MSDPSSSSQTIIHSGRCAFCGSSILAEVIDFGTVAIAGAFLSKDEISNERKYPLTVVFCENCYAVQVRDHIDPKVLFEKDFYFSSSIKTLRDHFADYAKEVTGRFIPSPKTARVLEFGSNDGVLLKPLAAQGIGTVIGIDPAKNIVETVDGDGLVLINGFFNLPAAKKIVGQYGPVDVIMANNVFAHITDINGTTEAVSVALKDDGVFIFEVHYVGNIIQGKQYDFIYHEHIYYYSLLALENHLARHEMVIFDIKPITIHGGSIRFHAAKKGSAHASQIAPSVSELRQKELELGLDKPETYRKFRTAIESTREKLMSLLTELRGNGQKVVGYGASGRANTIIQYCGITTEHIDYIVDDAPAKQGLYTPGSHIEIKGREALEKDKPDYILVFAWAFLKEIASKNESFLANGGKLIVPLPQVKVITNLKETEN